MKFSDSHSSPRGPSKLPYGRGVTSIEAEEAVASSLFNGPYIITIVNEAASSYFLCLCLLALKILVTPLYGKGNHVIYCNHGFGSGPGRSIIDTDENEKCNHPLLNHSNVSHRSIWMDPWPFWERRE